MSTVSSRSVSKGSDFEQVYASPIVLQLSGADEESIARHSRKRRERAFSDEDGKLAEDGRKRRSRGSSDENGTIGWVGFVNEDLRVGGPILCPLPLEISRLPPSHPLFQRLCSSGSPILGQVSSTIRSHGISYQQLSVCLQTYKFRPQDGSTVTISIIAKREQKDEQWRRAARAAQTYLKGVGLTQVAVEIADPQAFVPNHISPVRPGAKIYNRWSSVRDAITNEIDLADVKVIGCYRFGKSRTPRDNSITVIVIVDINSTRSWESARERIVKILARFELPMVAVSIFKDIIQRGFKSPVETLTEESLHGPALLGRSLGPAGEDNGTGTLGGFLNLKDPAGKWHTFGLTCFHCILPSNTRVARSSTINRARK
ncbi:hypothetical protein BJY00DRAFT_77636 [Aspergillus carlsbadensis]|nr:hypothetical protein BJY00DRAFT_77636 [Aspergillus carlsbadensis]